MKKGQILITDPGTGTILRRVDDGNRNSSRCSQCWYNNQNCKSIICANNNVTKRWYFVAHQSPNGGDL